jgi:phage-related protein (TIGR01555 family)
MAEITGGEVHLGHNGNGEVRIDGLQNVFTGMGTTRDKTTRTTVNAIKFMPKEDLEGLYVHWLMRRIVDLVADEATRQGFEILFGGEGVNAQTLSGVEQAIEDLEILHNFNHAAKTSRLYGGSAIILYIDDGRRAYEPVDVDNIRSVEGMEVLDRHQIAPVIDEDSLYDYSKPTHYQIISGDLIQQPNLIRIHKDRILRFDGIWLPYRVRQKNYGWGMSVLQSVYESFKHYYTGTSSIATLLTEFDIFVHKVRGLASMLAAGKETQVKNRLELNDMSKSIYRGYAIDAEKEELAFVSRQFGGVSEILEKLRLDVIAASGIPHTLLFGQSPSGLGATGRSEERDFAKVCHHYQEQNFRKPLMKLMRYVMASRTGPIKGEQPDNWRIGFKPLFEMNERELADVRARVAAVDARYIQVGVLTPQEVADSRFGKSEYSIETTIDPSIRRELPEKAAAGDVPPGGRDPLDQSNGTLPIDGTRGAADSAEVEDAAGLYLPGDLEHVRGDVKFTDKALHSRAVSAAKAKFKVWPSAYASGYVVQRYKEMYKRKHGSLSGAFKNDEGEVHVDDLAKWFKEEWVRIGANGEIIGPCGGRGEKEGKPKCLPKAKAQSLSKEERSTLVARKRRKDPDANRKGKAKMVSSKVDAKDPAAHAHKTKEEAELDAKKLGCDGHHVHETDDGPVYMPCSTHEVFEKVHKEFLEKKEDAIEPVKAEGLILSDIDEAAQITAEDIDAALNQWKQEAPERFKDILEAEDAEPTK